MKILVINGVNLNMLGLREVEVYGKESYDDLTRFIKLHAKKEKIKVKVVQSNYEGKIVEIIQKAYKKFDGIIINPGAYSHYSLAILDALKSTNLPIVEVHLSDVLNREDYRKNLLTSEAAFKVIYGQGFNGYYKALIEMKRKLGE